MKFNEIPKFIVNLERRPDRLASVKQEMDYIDWDYEIFKGIYTGCQKGISMSTLEILDIAKNNNYKRVMVIEDDIRFMPYAKYFLEKIENQIQDLEFAVFNLSPTLDRPINKSEKYNLLLDMTYLPPKKDYQRDIYGANMIIYDESIYDILYGVKEHPRPYYHPIDEFTFLHILNKYQSYCPILPIAPQAKGFSNIGNVEYSTFYMQTYNWNQYSPCKIPTEWMSEEKNQEIKKDKTHLIFDI